MEARCTTTTTANLISNCAPALSPRRRRLLHVNSLLDTLFFSSTQTLSKAASFKPNTSQQYVPLFLHLHTQHSHSHTHTHTQYTFTLTQHTHTLAFLPFFLSPISRQTSLHYALLLLPTRCCCCCSLSLSLFILLYSDIYTGALWPRPDTQEKAGGHTAPLSLSDRTFNASLVSANSA